MLQMQLDDVLCNWVQKLKKKKQRGMLVIMKKLRHVIIICSRNNTIEHL